MDAEENRRLAPLVGIAYRVYQGLVPLPAQVERSSNEPVRGCSAPADVYVEGLVREIKESYSARPGTVEYLVGKVRAGSLKEFEEADCVAAVRVLDAFLQAALFTESRLGDGAEAVAALQKEVPGLPSRLYSDVLGLFGYINR